MASKKARGADTERAGEIDTLFQLPLGDFTAARNALATRLKKSGRAADADIVKALPKPPVSAWTLNQLFWRHRPAFNKLLEAGLRFRTAQAAQLSGRSSDIRAPLEARREALGELSKLAAGLLRETAHSPTPDMMRRITTTLEALSTYGGLENAPQPGRLTADVDPPGFETLAALVPRIGKGGEPVGPSKVLPFQHQKPARKTAGRKVDAKEAERLRVEERKAHLAAAKQALQTGERALRDARKDAAEAESRLKKAAARAKETEKVSREIEREKSAIDRRYEKAAADAEAARQDARKIAEQAEAAAEAVEDAERAVEHARRELTSLADE
ncbi:MAG TPA: hypothetical protein VL173_10780 [Vicinamibacterales bacterium]|nr:hypothetical protein [Vicinamibacterales bacterium]